VQQSVGARILAKREEQRRAAADRRHIQRQRIGPAEISVAGIERAPVSGCKKILRPVVATKIGGDPKDCLAVAPGRGVDRIAGGDVERAAIAGDPARHPDPAARASGAPADDVAGIGQTNADDPAAIVAAITVMPAIGDIDPAVKEGERAALVLIASAEALALCRERPGDIDGPSGQRRAVLECQCEDPVMRPGGIS
jgi:hypothetical protein